MRRVILYWFPYVWPHLDENIWKLPYGYGAVVIGVWEV